MFTYPPRDSNSPLLMINIIAVLLHFCFICHANTKSKIYSEHSKGSCQQKTILIVGGDKQVVSMGQLQQLAVAAMNSEESWGHIQMFRFNYRCLPWVQGGAGMAHGPRICLCSLNSLQNQRQGSGLQSLCLLSEIPSVKPETSLADAVAKQCLFKDATARTRMTSKKEVKP